MRRCFSGPKRPLTSTFLDTTFYDFFFLYHIISYVPVAGCSQLLIIRMTPQLSKICLYCCFLSNKYSVRNRMKKWTEGSICFTTKVLQKVFVCLFVKKEDIHLPQEAKKIIIKKKEPPTCMDSGVSRARWRHSLVLASLLTTVFSSVSSPWRTEILFVRMALSYSRPFNPLFHPIFMWPSTAHIGRVFPSFLLGPLSQPRASQHSLSYFYFSVQGVLKPPMPRGIILGNIVINFKKKKKEKIVPYVCIL